MTKPCSHQSCSNLSLGDRCTPFHIVMWNVDDIDNDYDNDADESSVMMM